ncbi:MAG: histidine kinase [Saprospiraceae bacterium]
MVTLLSFVPLFPKDCDCGTLPPTWPTYAILAIGSTVVLTYRRRNDHSSNQVESRFLQQDAELKYLRDQVNPHFLFNTLNSIYSLAKDRSEQTPEVVLQLSTLLRYQLESAQLETVPLRRELDFLQDYLLLEDTRLGDRCRIEFELSREPARYLIYPMLLLPFVENAFKHGANISRHPSWIRVVVQVSEGRLDFMVENSVTPVKNSPPTTGTGINNVRRRLELLYPQRHQLNIDPDQPGRFVIQLKIQLDVAE